MTQVDLDTLPGGGGDVRAVVVDDGGNGEGAGCSTQHPTNYDPDFPAESFCLSVDDEIDWVDLNAAAFYDRDDSTKETTNPKSHHSSNPIKLQQGSTSQRISANPKPKGPIIGLPNIQNSAAYVGRKACRHAGQGQLFPKKKAGQGKSAVPEYEPGSPKVSCIGRVRSKKGGRGTGGGPGVPPEKEGSWFNCCRRNRAVECVEEEPRPYRRIEVSEGKRALAPATEEAAAEPGLAGMKRFASGRRTPSCSGDLEFGEVDGGAGGSAPLVR